MGAGGFFKKTTAPLSLMKTYRMSLISAGSISLDSTFNPRQTILPFRTHFSLPCQNVRFFIIDVAQ
jgi:hypothetical protein